MTAEYFNFLSLIGVAFFAISGALLGHDKDIGGFGVVVVGSVTALGGGTLRDILLNQPVFWIANPDFLYVTYGAIFVTVMFIRHLPDVSNYYCCWLMRLVWLFLMWSVLKKRSLKAQPWWLHLQWE